MKAHELLYDEYKWCKAEKSCFCCQACDANKRCVSAGDIRARSWTLYGVLTLCYSGRDFLAAYNRIRAAIGEKDIFEWNNAAGRTYEEVFNLLKELDL